MKVYPFPPDVQTEYTTTGWRLWVAKLFGKRFDERAGHYQIIAYYYRDVLYITRLNRG